MSWEQRLRELGLQLPSAAKPVGSYVPAKRAGKFVFTSGQLPIKDGKLLAAGKVPTDVSVPDAQAAASQAALNALAAVQDALASLDSLAGIVRVNVLVNSAPGFTGQAQVANGASDLLVEIFGQAGRHSRCAIGAAELPMNAPVELDIVAEMR